VLQLAGHNHPSPALKASWIWRCQPRPISIAVLRPAYGGYEHNDDEEDRKERVDRLNTIATANSHRHDCCLLLDLVRWLCAQDLLVLLSLLQLWQGDLTL
jgi:hypothetical protein